MRTTLWCAILVWGVIPTHASPAVADGPVAQPLRIVFIAYENPDQLLEDVRPIVTFFESSLQLPVKHFVATDYAAVVEALGNASADVGFMGPLAYVIAHDRVGAYAIAGEVYNGKSTYVSRIFVRKDSGLKSPADLRGKTIAFVDPLSSSGYLYPLDVFREAQLIPDREGAEEFFRRIYFAGGDEQAIRAVLNRFVDAAGVGQFASGLLRAEERDQVMSLADSRPIPSHCVVARKGLDPGLAKRVQDLLVRLDPVKDRKLLQYLYGVDGYIKVTDADYEPVEKLARSHGLLQ